MPALVSVVLEYRLAALAEGAHRFGAVLGRLADREMRRVQVQACPQVGGQRLIHRSLDHRYGDRRLPGDALGQSESLAKQLIVGEYMADDPDLAGFVGGQQVTGPKQLQGPRGADQPRQEVRAAGPGDEPDPDVSRTEPGGLSGEPDVAEKGHVHARADSEPVDRAYQRLIEVGCSPNDPMHALGEHAFLIDGIAAGGGQFIEVYAGTKASSCAGDHDRSHDIVALRRDQRIGPPVDHRPGERSELVWPVDADQSDTLEDLVGQTAAVSYLAIRCHSDSPSFPASTEPTRSLQIAWLPYS